LRAKFDDLENFSTSIDRWIKMEANQESLNHLLFGVRKMGVCELPPHIGLFCLKSEKSGKGKSVTPQNILTASYLQQFLREYWIH
jgi:hypothetical protein